MGINYKELLKKSEEQKYKNIYDQIPFIRGKDKREQLWWTRFYRLQNTWQKHYKTEFPGDRFVPKIIFNSTRPDDYRDANPWDGFTWKHGWLGHNHMVNSILCDVVGLFEDSLIVWENIPLFDIVFPEVRGFI